MKFYGGSPSPNYCLIRIIETSQGLEIRSHAIHREETHDIIYTHYIYNISCKFSCEILRYLTRK